eukprot:11138239-Karenia_brevis.AAC.1
MVPPKHTDAVHNMLHVTFPVGPDETACTVLPEGVSKVSAPYLGLCTTSQEIKHDHIPCGMNAL